MITQHRINRYKLFLMLLTAPPAKSPRAPQPALVKLAEACLSVGDTVEHLLYGTGRVHSLEGDKVVIEFERGGTRKFKEEFIRNHKR